MGRIVAMLALLLGTTVQAAPFAYVANEKSGTLSVIDTATDEVVGEIKAGKKPRGMAAARGATRIFVSDQPANALLVVDTEKRAVVSTIDLGESPEGVYVSPDGKQIAVAIEEDNAVFFLDSQSGEKLFLVKTAVDNPEHALFSTDG